MLYCSWIVISVTGDFGVYVDSPIVQPVVSSWSREVHGGVLIKLLIAYGTRKGDGVALVVR